MIKLALQLLSPGGQHGKLSIFIFHRVRPAPDLLVPDEPDIQRFDELVRWIAGWFHVLTLDDAVMRLRRGSLPARAAAITFDDGYADNLVHAVPILLKHGVSATFFISTGFLDGGRMWNDTIIESLRRTEVPILDCECLGLGLLSIGTTTEKRMALHKLIAAIKHLPSSKRSDAVARVADSCYATLPSDLMLTSGQLWALRQTGMGIGAHTVSHPILARTDDASALREIEESREFLQGILAERVGLFAYPNGKAGQDYLAKHVDMVRRVGFDAAFSTDCGVSAASADYFQLPRFTPWDRVRWKFGLRLVANSLRSAPHAMSRSLM